MNDAESQKAVWTRQALLKWAGEDFARRGIDTPRLDAELLLAHALGCKRVDLYLGFDSCPTGEERERFKALVLRRRTREPVAHIVGRKAFHDIELLVPAGTFVPRPETELVVDEALSRLRRWGPGAVTALDLCAGVGPIGLALAHAWPELRVWAVDCDERAVAALRDNAGRLGLSDRVTALVGDMFTPVPTAMLFDLITCNPPYVPAADIALLMPEVRDHEPRRALDGGEDGLTLIRRLMAEAPGRLSPGGWLLMEVGEGQAATVAALAGPGLHHEQTRADFAGVPRTLIFRKTSPG
jgi:release factor glutamine methyltransferase